MSVSLLAVQLLGCALKEAPKVSPAEFCIYGDAHASHAENELATICTDLNESVTSEGCYLSPPPISYFSDDGVAAACSLCPHGYSCDLNEWVSVWPCGADGQPDYDATPVEFMVPHCYPTAYL